MENKFKVLAVLAGTQYVCLNSFNFDFFGLFEKPITVFLSSVWDIVI